MNEQRVSTTRGRADTHAPSTFDPAEYREVGYFDNHPEDGGCWMEEKVSDKDAFLGNYQNHGRCDHCGAGPLRYGVIFLHEPSDTLVVVGTICARRLHLNSRSDLERKQLLEQAVRERKVRNWAAESADNAVVMAWFDVLDEDEHEYREAMQRYNDQECNGPAPKPKRRYNEFLSDVKRKLRKYGSLSEKQVAAVLSMKAREAEFLAKKADEAEAMAAVPALAEGRYEIEGEVLSDKWQESDYYDSVHKMLVRMDDGNKVWGSVPESVERGRENEDGSMDDLKGCRVKLTATVERSRDDEHFGFYKRPAKAEVIS